MFATYVFLDFETTGLVNPHVTSMSLIALASETSLQSKLVTYHNPTEPITDAAAKLTGLTKSRLQPFQPFSPDLLLCFLRAQQPPVCLLAHNGNAFDFAILHDALKASALQLPPNVYTVDTLDLFRELDFGGCRLYQLHQTLFQCPPLVSHDAEQDCITLIKCFFKAGCDRHLAKYYTFQ